MRLRIAVSLMALSVYGSLSVAYPVVVTTDKVRCSNGAVCLAIPGSECAGAQIGRIEDNDNGTYVFSLEARPDVFCRKIGEVRHKLECSADYKCKRLY